MNTEFLHFPKTRIYLLFFGLAITAMIVVGAFSELMGLWRILQAPATAVGTVTWLDCRNHGRVEYAFVIDGKSIPGSSRVVEGAPCPTLRWRQRVSVSYESGRPTNNFAFAWTDNQEGRESRAFWIAAAFLAGFVTLAPLFLILVARFFLIVRQRLGV